MPQRLTIKSPDRSHPLPQRMNSPISKPHSPLPKPQRMNDNSPQKHVVTLPSAQRLNQDSPLKNLSPKVSRAQRSFVKETPDKKFPLPQRMTPVHLRTPEMPQLKTVIFSPRTNHRVRKTSSPNRRIRSHSTPPVMKRPVEKIEHSKHIAEEHKEPESPPKSNSSKFHEVPRVHHRPVLSESPPKSKPSKFPEVPRVDQRQVEESRPSITVNDQLYYLVDRIGRGGSSEVFQVCHIENSAYAMWYY